jgi:CBS domain-containing protein
MQADIPTISANAKLDIAVRRLMSGQQPIIGVTDVDGKLIGLLTLENLGEMAMIHAALPGKGSAGQGP